MEKRAKEGTARGTLKKRHLGIAGLLTVLMQYGIGAKNDHTTQEAFQRVITEQLRTQKARIDAERERDFLRKSDFSRALDKLDHNLEAIANSQNAMTAKVGKIEGYLKARSPNRYSSIENEGRASE